MHLHKDIVEVNLLLLYEQEHPIHFCNREGWVFEFIQMAEYWNEYLSSCCILICWK